MYDCTFFFDKSLQKLKKLLTSVIHFEMNSTEHMEELEYLTLL